MLNLGQIVAGSGGPANPSPVPSQPPSQMQGQPQQIGSAVDASPEEQALLDHFVGKGIQLIYSGQAMPGIVETLKGDGDPVAGLATATVQVVTRVGQAAEKAGQQVPGDVLFEAGRQILQNLADLSAEAGIKDYSKDQDSLDGAFFRAVDDYRVQMQEAGKIDQAHYQGEMEALQQADQSGVLEQMLRQLARQDQENAQPQPEGQMSLRNFAGRP